MAAAARAAATALLRSAATKIASRAPPAPPLHPRRHFSRYARPGAYTQPPPPPATTTARISSKDHHLPIGGNPSISAAISEPTLARVDCDSTCAASYLVIVGGLLFLGWAERKKERDAAAKQKADDERFDAMMRDAYDEMVRVVGHAE